MSPIEVGSQIKGPAPSSHRWSSPKPRSASERVPGWYYYTIRREGLRGPNAVDVGSRRTHPISGASPMKIANAPQTHMKPTVMYMRRGCLASSCQWSSSAPELRHEHRHRQCHRHRRRRHHLRSGRPGHERRGQRAKPCAGCFRRRSHHDFTSATASTPSVWGRL